MALDRREKPGDVAGATTSAKPNACGMNRIEDYGLIGDLRTAALVGRDGSIDWLCLPRFDSGACFAALLGDERNGRWLLAPAGAVVSTSRRYRGETLVLETEFRTDDGAVRVVDCMPRGAGASRVVRIVEGLEGSVAMRMELVIRFDYGAAVPWVQRMNGGIAAMSGPDAVSLSTPVATHGENLTTIADFTVGAGDKVPFVLSWHASHEPPPAPLEPFAAVEQTESWWHEWSAQCSYAGEWRDEVVRSLITLKALTYEPTGGIVAAPTTSLPEELGGVRNWDYRFCWLRDAALTLEALIENGYADEAMAFRDWAMRAAAGDPAQLRIMYGVAGERRLPEAKLEWLSGYEGSAPVRVGNAAADQLQLDVYGELMNLANMASAVEGDFQPRIWRRQIAVMDFLECAWRKPDEGIWEVRGPRRHFSHSKVMAWVAFDRAIKMAERFGADAPLDGWKRIRQEIHDEVCREGYDAERNTFTQYYGSKELDAAVLLIPAVGFLPGDDPRVVGTIDAIQREITQDGLVRRYSTEQSDDGLPGTEGVFLPCSFFLADALALAGREAEARALFERLLALCNDVGLISEEYDTFAKRQVGNFPQAFTHLQLIKTASILGRQPALEAPEGVQSAG
jgi:GH15 family glucan-1,4-alpha-glucosidase